MGSQHPHSVLAPTQSALDADKRTCKLCNMSSLYSPFRAIGYVCDSNPFAVNRLGEEIFITVSIGKCFQIFRLNKLVACLVSKTVPGSIGGLQAIGHETFVFVDKSIVVYDRANIVRTYESHTATIMGSVSIGQMLLTFDQENNIKVSEHEDEVFVC
jgi:U3 small nucleolar RNA-associated protein 21